MIEQSTRIYTGLIAAILLFSVISSMPHYASAASSTGVTRTGVMISLYISPTSNTCGQYGGPGTTNCYDAIISVHNLHPSVPMVAKVNPSSGPGTAPDATHLNGYNKLKAAGITVLGYVPTHYAADSIASKEILIDDYKNWYNLDGIFFDEMKNSGAESYYSTLTNYVKNVDGMKMTVCNPGTSVPQSYVGTCDTIEIAESAGLPSLSTLQSRTFYPNYDKSNFFMLAHDTNSITQTDVTDRMPYVGYEYITNDVEPNPYDTIPPYFLDEVAYLDTGSPTPSPTPTSTLPGSPTGLTATTVSSSQINLSWSFPSGTISGYKIERSTSGGTFSTIVSNTATTATTYSDTGLASATQYTYRVSAINGIGTSTPSSSASATTVLSSSPPTTSGVAALSGVSGFKSSLYLNPGTNGINWQPLIAAKQAHPRVPIIAMINPSSGPGTSYDSNFNAGINNLRAAGIIVLGYIGTKYCAMTLSTAEGQIDTYHSFYKLDGFLFDEMKNTSGCESYYSTLTNYAKSTYGDTLIIGNPGTSTIQSYVGTVDNIIIYESQGLPSISTLQSRTFGLAKSGFCFDAYGISTLDPTYAAQASQYVGCMQITDDSGSNPYDTLPSYLSSEIAALDTGSSSALPSILINPTTGPAGSTIAVSGNSFLSNSAVTVSYDSAAVTTNPGAITTDSSGSFTATFTEPAPSTGSHTVIAKDAASGLASAQFTVTSTTPPTTPPTTISLTVNSVDLSGNSFTGQWVQLNDSSGNTIATGFTPATFSVTSGSQYTVFAANFQNVVFNHWSDGNTNPSRAITPTQSTTLTAYYSTSSTTTPPPSPTSPSSPTGLTATTVSSSQINLSWTAPSGTISGYKIERSTSGGTFSTIVSNTATTATTYSDTGLASATQYTYRVSAINSVGTSSPSNTGSATTLTPIPPSILINPTTGPAGSTIAVSGNTFLSNSAVTISYDGAAVTTNPGTITTDSSGSFTATFTEPAPSTGSHTVIAKDAASGLASAQFTVTSTTSSTTSTTISLTVNSVDLSGNSFTGQWVTLRNSSGNTIATGFTPTTFSVASGSQYTVFAANFQNIVFNHWSDGNTNPSRAITPTQSTTLTAYYTIGTTTVSVTVKSADLSGNLIKGMWVTLRDSSGNTIATGYTPKTFTVTSGAQYTIHAANFKHFVFNHWDDGSTNSWRTISTTQSTTLVSYYSK